MEEACSVFMVGELFTMCMIVKASKVVTCPLLRHNLKSCLLVISFCLALCQQKHEMIDRVVAQKFLSNSNPASGNKIEEIQNKLYIGINFFFIVYGHDLILDRIVIFVSNSILFLFL